MTTVASSAALMRYVRELADLVGLRDWQFTVRPDAPDGIDPESTGACIAPSRGRKWACLWVPWSWWEGDPEERRQTIVHELLHCHTWPAEAALESAQTNLGDAAWGVLHTLHKGSLEYAVDAIADALAPHLPLPPDPEATP